MPGCAVTMSREEQDTYRGVHRTAAGYWASLKERGPAYVRSHLFTATSLLMPLRRMCSGGTFRPEELRVPDPEARERAAAAAGAERRRGERGGARHVHCLQGLRVMPAASVCTARALLRYVRRLAAFISSQAGHLSANRGTLSPPEAGRCSAAFACMWVMTRACMCAAAGDVLQAARRGPAAGLWTCPPTWASASSAPMS